MHTASDLEILMGYLALLIAIGVDATIGYLAIRELTRRDRWYR
ncbi:hypothetical protein [Kitasatospora sp. McL0602]